MFATITLLWYRTSYFIAICLLDKAAVPAPQSRGADPGIRTEDYDPYLDPGKKIPVELAIEDEEVRAQLLALEKKYASINKVREPHPNIGCWWTLYDHGLDAVRKWPKDHHHRFPGAPASPFSL